MRRQARPVKLMVSMNLVLSLVLSVSLLAMAGPFAPSQRSLPHDVQSLAGLDVLRLDIAPVPRSLALKGFTSEKVRDAWRDGLSRAGIDVDDGEADGEFDDAPTLTVRIEYLTDPAVPDGVAVLALLTLVQDVRVDRLDKPLRLPTYTQYTVALEHTDNVRDSMRLGLLNEMIEQFTQRARLATKRR